MYQRFFEQFFRGALGQITADGISAYQECRSLVLCLSWYSLQMTSLRRQWKFVVGQGPTCFARNPLQSALSRATVFQFVIS